jgi:hypothetical protein
MQGDAMRLKALAKQLQSVRKEIQSDPRRFRIENIAITKRLQID